jgi:hypothetical protein
MKFTMPGAESPEEAERRYGALRTSLTEAGNKITDRRIRSIGFSRDGKPHSATVEGLDTPSGDTVSAIFESHPDTLFLISTQRRNGSLGVYFAGSPSYVEDFDAADE